MTISILRRLIEFIHDQFCFVVSKCTYMFKEYLHLSFVNLSIFYTINSNLKSDHFFSIKCLEQIKSKKKNDQVYRPQNVFKVL